jgi:putative addiction module component (TIGR02574 family)
MDETNVFDLSTPEKLQLVEDLWDDLSSDAESVPVRDWHKDKLDNRKKSFEENPGLKKSWKEIKATVQNQNDR